MNTSMYIHIYITHQVALVNFALGFAPDRLDFVDQTLASVAATLVAAKVCVYVCVRVCVRVCWTKWI